MREIAAKHSGGKFKFMEGMHSVAEANGINLFPQAKNQASYGVPGRTHCGT